MTMKRPLLSAIIPVFGRSDHLSKAIISVLAELGPKDELIVIDDGSEPPITIAEFLSEDRRLQLVRSVENNGAATARNLGIAIARHPLLAFLDSDDVWLPGKLNAQLQLFTKPDGLTAVVCGWIDTKDGISVRTRIPRASRQRRDFFSGCWFAPGSTLIITKKAYEHCGSFREDLSRLEDFEWFIRFALAGGNLIVAPVVGVKIAKGNNAYLGPVEVSAKIIWSLYGHNKDLTRSERRCMAAFLALTQASAAYNSKDWNKFIFQLFRSFVQVPRFRLHLDRWWKSVSDRKLIE